jgi:hypothetical protein
METARKLEDEVTSWLNVSVHPHRFGGKDFLFESAEIGHTHEGGSVDIAFPRAVRNALLASGLAEQHHRVPNSGWITFQIRNEEDLSHTLWLMRLSYIRENGK